MGMAVFIIQTWKIEDTNYFERKAFFQAANRISNNSGSIWRSRRSVCRCIQAVLNWRIFMRSSLRWLSGIPLEPWVNSLLQLYMESNEMLWSHQGQMTSTTRLPFAKITVPFYWLLHSSLLDSPKGFSSWQILPLGLTDKAEAGPVLSLFPANTSSNRLWLVCSCTPLASVCLVLWQCKLWHKWLFQPFLNWLSRPWRRIHFVNVVLTQFGAIHTGLWKHFISHLSWK